MSVVRGPRRVVLFAALLIVLAAGVLAGVPLSDGPGSSKSPALAPAADTSAFRPGNIISDAVFYDSGAMNAAQVQSFLNAEGVLCRQAAGETPCLKNYRQTTETQAADSFCRGRYTGAANETAATIIAKVSVACGINPRVILVMLQKETSLVTRTDPTAHVYDRAMGFGCPDNVGGTCSAYYPGFFRQVYFAAKQFKRYAANPTSYGHVPGLINNVRFHPNAACGSSPVRIENKATASLYNYTPYQPNSAALAAGYGAANNSCSSYGNRNFWLYFTDWFGSTQTVGRDVDAPLGSLELVAAAPGSISVGGWALDPNAPTSINVHVYVDGKYAAAIPANRTRPDVAAVFPDAGAMHGFSGAVVAAPGARTACVYAVNTGPGYSNPRLGCRKITVPTPPAHVPTGNLETATVTALSATVSGWGLDPDAQTSPVRIHLYVDGRWRAAVTADQPRTDVATAYPRAGDRHGFTWTGTLPAGKREICAYAINLGAGRANPKLACRTVTIGGSPVGVLEQVTATAAQVQVKGWALDPDTVGPAAVHVWINGHYATAVVADDPRSDVESARPGYGPGHGFDLTVPAVGGAAEVCVYGIDIGWGSNARLGCRTVTVPASPPVGNLDGVTVSGTSITAAGWALDKDAPTTPLRVHLAVDGRVRTATTADKLRPDVGAAFPGTGNNHGYTTDPVVVGQGTHTVCAIGINQPSGSGTNPTLACRSVVVP